MNSISYKRSSSTEHLLHSVQKVTLFKTLNTVVRLYPEIHSLSHGRHVPVCTWVNFCREYAAGLSEPLTLYSLFCGHL